jgi:DNA recombination protein RmuC
VLRAVKTEFNRFGDVLARLGKQLDTAKRTVDQTGVRTRAMERQLRNVETLPGAEATRLLELPEDGQDDVPEDDSEDQDE